MGRGGVTQCDRTFVTHHDSGHSFKLHTSLILLSSLIPFYDTDFTRIVVSLSLRILCKTIWSATEGYA